MSEADGRGPTDAGRVVFAAAVHPVKQGRGPTMQVDRFVLVESQLEGWTGYVKIAPGGRGGLRERAGLAETFSGLVERYLFPGQAIVLALAVVVNSGGQPEPIVLRQWPAVVTRLTTSRDQAGRVFAHVHFSDTVTYLGGRPVWGVFRDCTLAEAVGGAISLAVNGDGTPTLAPACLNLPEVVLTESVREAMQRLPYVVAAGETLGVWLARVLGRVGVRMEMVGDGGTVAATLKDGPPGGNPLEFTFGDGPASATNAVLRGAVMQREGESRDAVLDNPSTGEPLKVRDAGAVSTLVTTASTDLEEAAYRARLVEEFGDVAMAQARVVTSQSGILPGRRLLFDRPVGGARVWQAGLTEHGYADGSYFNTTFLVKDGAAWRPRGRPNSRGATLVSGVVNDGASPPGTVVARDRLGRIPVSLHFEVAAAEGADEAGAAARAGTSLLPVVDPIAGGTHGFVPEHRQGDRCRLAVNSPLDVEVVGFQYDDQRRIRSAVADGSMGIIVDHEPEAWAGVLFRPDEHDDKDSRDWGADDGDADASSS